MAASRPPLLPLYLLSVLSLLLASAFPNTTTNQVLFAPFSLEPTSTVPSTFLSFNFGKRAFKLVVGARSGALTCLLPLAINYTDPYYQPIAHRPGHSPDWNLNATAVDAWSNASIGWTLDLQNPRLLELAKALPPANLQIGGSNEDVAEYALKFDGHQCSAAALAKHTTAN